MRIANERGARHKARLTRERSDGYRTSVEEMSGGRGEIGRKINDDRNEGVVSFSKSVSAVIQSQHRVPSHELCSTDSIHFMQTLCTARRFDACSILFSCSVEVTEAPGKTRQRISAKKSKILATEQIETKIIKQCLATEGKQST